MPDNFNLGFDYYPEHWPESMWAEDLQRMRDMGVSCVRIAEYAWSRMEPREGQFEFAWLDRFFDLAGKHGISIILGTPTDGIPPWAWQKYPDVVYMEENGLRNTMNRRMRCPTSPNLRMLAEKIITRLGERYGKDEQLIGWQLDNELMGWMCYCDSCRKAVRDWLRAKYETIENFNRELGMVFWAHEVTDWEQIILPRYKMDKGSPSVRLEVQKAFSDLWVDFMRHQVELIRPLSPGRWITHNLPGLDGVHFDLFDATEPLDFMSIDSYPRAMLDGRYELALRNDVCHSLQDGPHWFMELQTGTPCTKFYKAPIPREGQLRLWGHQCAAHGAEGVVFFRWRKSPVGQEMFGNGLLDQDSRPRRMFPEIKQLGADFAKLAEAMPAYAVRKEVAIAFDFADRENAGIHAYPMGIDYYAFIERWHRAARDLGLNVHFVRSTDDLTPYAMVLAPTQFTTSPKIAENFANYVRQGGVLVGALRMGWFDEAGKPACKTLPGGMAELFGIEVDEYERVMEPNPNSVRFEGAVGVPNGGSTPCHNWNYILNDLGAKALAKYESDYYAGRTCVSENTVGDGRAIYVGTVLESEALRALLRYLAGAAKLAPLPADWPLDVESMNLEADGKPVRVLLNHALEARKVALDEDGADVLSGQSGRQWDLEPMGLRWIR